MSSIAHDSCAIGGKLYGVSIVMMIVVTSANYGPMVHGSPSSCWTATADPMGKDANTGEASLLFLFCLSTSLL